MDKRYKLDHENGRWCVKAYDAANAVWFSVGGATDLNTTLKLWLGVLSNGKRK